MPGIKVSREEIEQRIKEMTESNPELRAEVEEFEKEYRFRKKVVLTEQAEVIAL